MVYDNSDIPTLQAQLAKGSHRAVENVGEAAVERVDTGFNRGEDAMGRPWQELADSTIEQKGHALKLIDEADLKNSNTYVTAENRARIGTNDPKATYHEMGVPENGLPARPIYGPLAEWLDEENVVEEELVKQVNVAIVRSTML